MGRIPCRRFHSSSLWTDLQPITTATSGYGDGRNRHGLYEHGSGRNAGLLHVFNSIDPQRGPLALPLLGMSVGDNVWILASPRSTFGEYTWIPGRQIQTASRVHYWGHYPVVDMEFEMPGSPVSAGVRAWSPFLPGDSATSNTPGAVFDVHLRNDKQDGAGRPARLHVSRADAGRGPDHHRQSARYNGNTRISSGSRLLPNPRVPCANRFEGISPAL